MGLSSWGGHLVLGGTGHSVAWGAVQAGQELQRVGYSQVLNWGLGVEAGVPAGGG